MLQSANKTWNSSKEDCTYVTVGSVGGARHKVSSVRISVSMLGCACPHCTTVVGSRVQNMYSSSGLACVCDTYMFFEKD